MVRHGMEAKPKQPPSLGALRADVTARLESTRPIFQAGEIAITPALARFGDASYSISNIGSVSLSTKETRPSNSWLLSFAVSCRFTGGLRA